MDIELLSSSVYVYIHKIRIDWHTSFKNIFLYFPLFFPILYFSWMNHWGPTVPFGSNDYQALRLRKNRKKKRWTRKVEGSPIEFGIVLWPAGNSVLKIFVKNVIRKNIFVKIGTYFWRETCVFLTSAPISPTSWCIFNNRA